MSGGKLLLLIGCLGLVALSACRRSSGGVFASSASGRPYDVLLVMDDSLRRQGIGRMAEGALSFPATVALWQGDPLFRVLQATPADMDATLRSVRNILWIEVDASCGKPEWTSLPDKYASFQQMVELRAGDVESLREWLPVHGQELAEVFDKAERTRFVRRLEREHNEEAGRKADSLFHCRISFPKELARQCVKKDFLWASTRGWREEQHILVYACPVGRREEISASRLLHIRDSVVGRNIEGEREGICMATDSLRTTVVRKESPEGKVWWEERGWWYMRGDVMGGPFVSHVHWDSLRRRLVTVEAFAYAPDKNKNRIMRRLEAALYTIKIKE